MFSATTNGIKVTVRPKYNKEMSRPDLFKYLHAYHITIENHSDSTCQLLSREWHIKDSNGDHRTVKGEGVVSQQPIIEPGRVHSYASWCPLTTPIGYMYGSFTMRRLVDDSLFEVEVPRFDLLADHKNN